jgi:hypothetical protein
MSGIQVMAEPDAESLLRNARLYWIAQKHIAALVYTDTSNAKQTFLSSGCHFDVKQSATAIVSKRQSVLTMLKREANR